MTEHDIIAFGPFRLDRHSRTLTRDGASVAVQGQALDVLIELAAAGGSVVGKDALLQKAWGGAVVEENNLQRQISTLRKTMGESVITTAPGRGYRLTVARPGAGLGADGDEVPGKPAVAVLPFECLANDVSLQFFTAGIAGDIATALAQTRSMIIVVPQSESNSMGGSAKAMRTALGQGVRYALQGSVRASARQIRINVRLVDAETGVQLWAEPTAHSTSAQGF